MMTVIDHTSRLYFRLSANVKLLVCHAT